MHRRMGTLAGPVLVLAFVLGACSFDALVAAPPTDSLLIDRLAGSVLNSGFQVWPAVIHPGDEVLIGDLEVPGPGALVPIYYWDACAGTISQPTGVDREVTWRAPEEPGVYSVTVNVTNTSRDNRSTVIDLCVVPEGEDTCSAMSSEAPELTSLVPSYPELNQDRDCAAGRCTTDVTLEAADPDGRALEYRWVARRGAVTGGGPTIQWRLPRVGCCTEEFSIAVTACDAEGRAVTGFTYVQVTPD